MRRVRAREAGRGPPRLVGDTRKSSRKVGEPEAVGCFRGKSMKPPRDESLLALRPGDLCVPGSAISYHPRNWGS